MKSGSIAKIVTSFGSSWGRIQPAGESRLVFFNRPSLVTPGEFADLTVGQAVEFEEERDRVNGLRATSVRPASPLLESTRD